MKITIIDCPEGDEEEIVIKCKQTDEQILKMIYTLKAGRDKFTAFKDGSILQVEPKNIYYFEAVENKTFLYLEKEILETKFKLYELEERFQGTDFFRVSKSTILSLSKVARLSPSLGGRFEALMKNGEKLIISRQYVPALKEKLGL